MSESCVCFCTILPLPSPHSLPPSPALRFLIRELEQYEVVVYPHTPTPSPAATPLTPSLYTKREPVAAVRPAETDWHTPTPHSVTPSQPPPLDPKGPEVLSALSSLAEKSGSSDVAKAKKPKPTCRKEPSAKTKKRKSDADPNAPKKPSNAFFWFCQELRPTLQEHFRGEGVAGQHDLTKVLAKLWSEVSSEEKQVICGSLIPKLLLRNGRWEWNYT